MSSECCYTLSLKNREMKRISQLFKIFSEVNRLKILFLLQKDRLCVCEMIEKLDLPQNLTSHHLRVLEKTRLVTNERKGRRIYYSLTPEGRKIIKPILGLLGRGGAI